MKQDGVRRDFLRRQHQPRWRPAVGDGGPHQDPVGALEYQPRGHFDALLHHPPRQSL